MSLLPKISLMQRIGFLLLLSLVSALGSSRLRSDDEHFSFENWKLSYVSSAEVAKNALFIDARTESFYAKSHILGAMSLTEESWDSDLAAFLSVWKPERPVIVYCGGQSCGVSKRVALRLKTALPTAEVHILKGGYPAWQRYQEALSR